MSLRKAFLFASLLGFLVVSTASGQEDFQTTQTASASTISDPWTYLDHKFGRLHTFQWELEKYLHYLKNSSDRLRLIRYGKTYEGRNLYLVIISAPENLARLEEIRTANLKLTDPRKTTQSEAKEIADWLPTIVWLGYNIHGNEASGMEAALQTIYHLVSGEDEQTRTILQNVVCIIDPVQNPDGHDRFVQHVRSVMTTESRPNPDDIEHLSPWPGGRTNHYYFDLNRDFFLQTQIESQQRIQQYHRWMPHVFADLHEMGPNATYFFAPPMSPYNEYVTPLLRKWWNIFARGNAAAFDRHGWGYYTKESFDAFYPGYGVSYPSINGAVGMTYEQASARGVSIYRNDGTVLTLREAALHHYTTSLATLATAAVHRREKVMDFYRFFSDALSSAKNDPFKEILLLPGQDDELMRRLLAILLPMGVEIQRTREAFTLSAHSYWNDGTQRRSFPAGTFLIHTAQPQRNLIKALLAPEAPLSPDFIAEEKKRRENRERSHFYDITAWSLPLTFGVEAYWTERSLSVPTEPVTAVPELTPPPLPRKAKQAYLIPFHSLRATKLLAQLLRKQLRVRIATQSFTLDGRAFAPGTLVLRVNRNPDSLHTLLADLAGSCRVEVVPVDHGLAESGVDLGSNTIVAMKQPKIALLTGEPVSAYSNGAIQYLFEQHYHIHFTRLPPSLLNNLAHYNLLILPDGRYGRRLTGEQRQAIREWVQKGGTLVAIGGAVEAILDSTFGLSRLQRFRPKDDQNKPVTLPPTPGAIVKLALNRNHFLTYGCPENMAVLLRSRTFYNRFDDPHKNVVWFTRRLSGFIWPETEKYVQDKLFVAVEPVGRGKIIHFTEDPNFRASYWGLNKLFTNAVLLAPSF